MSILSLQGSYRVAAGAGDGMSSSDSFHEAMLALISTHIAPGSQVLDLGAGAGLFSRLLAKSGCRVVSADLFPQKCSVPCRQVDLNTPFSVGFSDSFDAICCLEVIEHLENPRQVLRECRRLLKPGGILFVSTPDASGLYSRLRFFLTGEFAMFGDAAYKSIGHITPISYWQMRKMLDENNLEIVQHLDYDGSATVPRTIGDAVKIIVRLLRPILAGHVGRQVMAFACRAP
jgi:2-polyprenyl-3-methyl-5-hydroxy-6-metoxy-1,4-benzoquinol methylase